MMRNLYTSLWTLTVTSLCLLSSACTVITVDPRCQVGQYCAYTDPPAPIRTQVLRSGS
jgi:hypothetical protein